MHYMLMFKSKSVEIAVRFLGVGGENMMMNLASRP